MTRFIYLADTHLGFGVPAYQMQQAYPEKGAEILDALEAWIGENGPVDFILHGGDMVDAGTVDAIRLASGLFRLSVPVYLCLGNHDVTERCSLESWLALNPALFPGGSPEYTIETRDCAIHVVPNHWSATPHYWQGGENRPGLFPAQLEALGERCKRFSGRTQILLTHSPVLGVPPEQTGYPAPFHAPEGPFAQTVLDWVETNPDIRSVLGAHSHMNMSVERGGVHYVTASALMETPFEFKLFEASPGSLEMKTVSLADRLSFRGNYNWNRTFVQGRECDRGFSKELTRSV